MNQARFVLIISLLIICVYVLNGYYKGWLYTCKLRETDPKWESDTSDTVNYAGYKNSFSSAHILFNCIG